MDRESIINSYSKSDFMNFLSSDSDGKILELFNEDGINIIKKSDLREERICYILVYSPYKNELLQNISFLDMFLNSDITSYYAVLNNLDLKTYDIILKRCIKLNKDPEIIATLFGYFSSEYKLNILDNWNYSNELLYCILKNDEPAGVQKIISNYNFTNLLSPFQEIYESFKNYKLEELRLDKGLVNDDNNYYEYKREFLNLINKLGDTNLYYDFDQLYKENGLESIEEYLIKLSWNSLSNYIIDYHFEENYHNIMLDVHELLNFYYNGNIVIPKERVELYNKISNIDYLSPEEKIELHEYLKNFNMIEISI